MEIAEQINFWLKKVRYASIHFRLISLLKQPNRQACIYSYHP